MLKIGVTVSEIYILRTQTLYFQILKLPFPLPAAETDAAGKRRVYRFATDDISKIIVAKREIDF